MADATVSSRAKIRFRVAGAVLAVLLAQPPVHALLNIDGTRNQVFVFGSVGYAYDSNIFSDSGGNGDYTSSAHFGMELRRRRGIIAVNATATVDYLGFNKFKEENSWNPSFNAELHKTTGRMTGSLTVSAFRTSRADSAVNLRVSSWNFPVGLSIKYPVNDKLYVTSSTGYLKRQFADTTRLANYYDVSEGIEVYYTYNSKIDLVAAYRIRLSETPVEGLTYDHSVSLGVTGGLLPKLNGSLRAGYQIRDVLDRNEQFGQLTVSASLRWVATRKFSVSVEASRDFSTTALGGSVDTTSAAANAAYAYNRRLEFSAGVGGGRNRFLGDSSLDREDMFFSWHAGARYSHSEHFVIGGSYTYMKNWSTFEFSDFDRSSYTIDISSRF